MTTIAVQCDGGREEGWTCRVTLREGGVELSTHRVRVSTRDLDRLVPGAQDPTSLVEASFEFLLEHESPHLILRSFELTEIGRYFGDYETDIRRRAGGS